MAETSFHSFELFFIMIWFWGLRTRGMWNRVWRGRWRCFWVTNLNQCDLIIKSCLFINVFRQQHLLIFVCAISANKSVSLTVFSQALPLWDRTLSSPWSHTSLSLHTCPFSHPNTRSPPSPRTARPPSASAASQRRSTPPRGWRNPAAAGPSSLSCSSWAWRRSSRSRNTSPLLTGQWLLSREGFYTWS